LITHQSILADKSRRAHPLGSSRARAQLPLIIDNVLQSSQANVTSASISHSGHRDVPLSWRGRTDGTAKTADSRRSVTPIYRFIAQGQVPRTRLFCSACSTMAKNLMSSMRWYDRRRILGGRGSADAPQTYIPGADCIRIFPYTIMTQCLLSERCRCSPSR
jgi:hypothetical protein